MTGKEPEVWTMTDVVRNNLKKARGDESRRALAARIAQWTDDPTWNEWRILDIEGGRQGRQRTVSVEELVMLAIAHRTSVMALLSPPDGVMVRVGQDLYSPATFDYLVFNFPPPGRLTRRERLDELARSAYEVELNPADFQYEASVMMDVLRGLVDSDPSVSWMAWLGDPERFKVYRSALVERLGDERVNKYFPDTSEEEE